MLTWSYSENDEVWRHNEFATVEECILDAKENHGIKSGESIAIGTIYPYTVCVDITEILERVEEDAYEECGEAAENWSISSRRLYDEAMDELQEKVNGLVNEYLEKIGEPPNFSRIDAIYTVTID